MSSQSTKKKRIGSRRRATNQNKTSEADEILETDSTSVAKLSIPGGNQESVNALSDPDKAPSQSENPPSPELPGNRRKLGSSRRSKGGRHVQDSSSVSVQKLREETEENQSSEMTRMSLAEQSEGKDCLIKGHDYEILSEEGIATVYSVKEIRDKEDTKDVLMQDGKFLSNYLLSESNVEPVAEHFSHPQEQVTGESSLDKHEETERNKPEGQFSTSNEELSTEEEQSKASYLSEVKDSLQSDQVVSTDGEEMEQMHVIETDHEENLMHEGQASEISETLFNSIEVSDSTGDSLKTQEVLNPDNKQNEKNVKENSEAKKENYHMCDIEKPLTTDTDRIGSELGEVSEKECRHDDNMEPSVEQAFHQPKELIVDLSRSSLQMLQSETATNFESQIHDDTLTVDEHSSGFSATGNRRKMGSSRRKKERQQIRDSADELYHKPAQEVVECSVDNGDLVTNASLLAETLLQGNSVESTLEEMTNFDTFETEKLSQGENILEGNSSAQHAEAEASVEKAAFPSPEEDLPAVEEHREVFLLSEAKGAYPSEDSFDVALEHEEDMLGTEQSSKLLTLNAVENSEIVSDKQINQDKGSDLSQFTKTGTDDFATKEKDLNLYEMQEEHPLQEDNFEAFDQSNKGYLKRPQREDKELGQSEGKVEDGVELGSEQTDHFEKEMDNIKSFQTLKSEELVSLNSKPLPASNSLNLSADETYQGPKQEDIEMTKDDEVLEPKQISLPQEDRLVEDNLEEMDTFDTVHIKGSDTVQHDTDFDTSRNAGEETVTNVQSSSNINQKLSVESTANEPDKELYHLFPQTTEDKESVDKTTKHLLPDVNVQGNFLGNRSHFNSEERDLSSMLTESHIPQEDTQLKCSVDNEEFSSPEKAICTNEDLDDISICMSKAEGVLHSKDAVNEVHEQGKGVKLTQMEEMHYPNERVTNNASDNSALLSGHQEEQESGSRKSGGTNFATVLEDSDGNEQKGALSDNEECRYSLTTLQHHLEGPALHCLNRNEQTHTAFNPVKIHRKLGSSRRYKDRKQDKDSVAELYHEQKDDVEITSVNEEFEPSQKIPETQKISCGELYQDSESNFTMPETDNFLCPDNVPVGDQNPTTSNYHETGMENLIPVRDIPQENHHERDGYYKVEKSDKSVIGTCEDRDQSVPLENEGLRGVQDPYKNQDVKPAPVNQQNTSINVEGLSGDLTEEEISNTYQSEPTETVHASPNGQKDLHPHDKHEGHAINSTSIEGLDQANNKLWDSDAESSETVTEDILPGQADETEGHIKDEIKPLSEKTGHPEEMDLCFEAEKGESLSQTQHLEIHASQSEDQQTDSIQERDSTAESYQSHTEEDIQEARENLSADTKELSLREETEIQDKPVTIKLDQEQPVDTAWAEDIGNHGDDNAHVDMTVDELPEIGSIAHLQPTSQSTFNEVPEDKLPPMCSVLEKDSTEKEEDKDLSRQDGNLQVNNVESESAFGQELFIEKYKIKEDAENGSVAQAVSTNKEETEHVTVPQVGVGLHSGFSVDEAHKDEVKTTQMPEEYQPVHPTSEEDNSSGQAQWSEMNAPSNSEPQPVKAFGSRRKLGSSRRHKGRQHVQNTFAETLQEPTEGFVDKESGDEALDLSTADILSSNEENEEVPEDKLPPMCSVLEKDSTEQDEDKDLSRQDGNLQVNNVESESAFGQELFIEKYKIKEDAENGSVAQAVSTNKEETEHVTVPHVGVGLHSGFSVDEAHKDEVKTTQMPEEYQPVHPTSEEDNSSGQALWSEMNAPSNSEPQPVKAFGSRRKLGSSRRHKGRQHVQNTVAETLQEPTEGFVDKESGDEALDLSTADILSSNEENEEVPEDKLPQMSSVLEKDSTEQDEDKDLSRQDGNLQVDNVESESAFGQELFIENYKIKEDAENGSVAQAVSTNKEETEHVTVPHVGVGLHSGFSVDEAHKDEVKTTQMPEEYQPVHPTSEEDNSSGQALWSEMNAPSNSEPQPVKAFGSRRKLGSSRRHKGRQHVQNTVAETLQEPTEGFVDKESGDEALDLSTADILSSNEENEEVPEDKLPQMSSVLEKDSTEQDEDKDLSRQDGNLQVNNVESESAFGQELFIENYKIKEDAENGSVAQAVSTNKEETEHVTVPHVGVGLHSGFSVDEAHKDEVKTTQMPEEYQPVHPTSEEDSSSGQAQWSEMNAPSNSEPQPVKAFGSRRKLGSSRRHKGRQHVQNTVAETLQEPTEGFVDKESGDEALDLSTADILSSNEENEEVPEDKLPPMCSVLEKDSTEQDEDKDLSRQDGNLQVNNVESESAFGQELFIEKYKIKEDAENGSVAQAVSTNKEETEHVTVPHVGVGLHSGFSVDEAHKDEVKTTQMPEEYQPVHPTSEEDNSSGQALWSEMNAPSNSEPQPVKAFGSRRKLGSSRRHKGRQHVQNTVAETLQEPTEGFVDKESGDEALDLSTADILSSNEENEEVPEDKLPQMSSVLEKDSTEQDEDKDLSRQDGNLQVNNVESESAFGQELFIENYKIKEDAENGSVAQAVSTNKEETEHVTVPHVGVGLHSGFSVDEAHKDEVKTTQMPEEYQPVHPTSEEDSSSGQAQWSEMNAPSNSEPQPVKAFGSRRKLGSSRRHKGRQHVQNTVAETLQEPTEGFVDKESSDEALDLSTADILSSNEENKEVPEDKLPQMSSVLEKDSTEQDEDKDLSRQDGNLQVNNVESESAFGQELFIEKYKIKEDAENGSVAQAVSTNKEETEHVTVPHVGAGLHSGFSVDEAHKDEVKTTQMPEEYQPVHPTSEEDNSSGQAQWSEMNAPSNSEPQPVKAFGSRRKLGSSRRHKGRQHVQNTVAETLQEPTEGFVDKESSDEALDLSTADILSSNEENKQEESDHSDFFKSTTGITNGNYISVKILSQNDEDNGAILSADTLRLNIDDLEQVKVTNDPGNLSQHTEYDTTDLIQSPNASALKDDVDCKNTARHDDEFARLSSCDHVEQEDDYYNENKEALTCDKDKDINMQQINAAEVKCGQVTVDDCNTDVRAEMDVPVSKNDKVEENLMNKDQDTKDTMASEDIIDPESDKTDPLAPLDSDLLLNFKEEQTGDVDDGSRSENLPEKSNKRKRKLGSSRRLLRLKSPAREQDSKDETKKVESDAQMEVRNLERVEVMEEFTGLVTAEFSSNENVKPPLSLAQELLQESSELGRILDTERNLQSNISDQPTSENSVVNTNPPLSSKTEEYPNTGITDGGSVSPDETIQSSQNDEECVSATQNQTLESAEELIVAEADVEAVKTVVSKGEEQSNTEAVIQEPYNLEEEAHFLEIENANVILNLPQRRRKMGSSRKNPKNQGKTKEEDLSLQQEEDNEAVEATKNAVDAEDKHFSGIKEGEQKVSVEQEDSDSELKKAVLSETVEYTLIDESHLAPPAPQSSEENPDPESQIEHQLTPNYISASHTETVKLDEMSESASDGRRRKMGSSRKARAQLSRKKQTAREDKITEREDGEDDGGGITEESNITAVEEQSLAVPETSKVDKTTKSALETGDDVKPTSEKTPQLVAPVQQPSAEISLVQESQKPSSLVDSRLAAEGSNCYNVVMVGNSNVGKTSFMQRAQSGKFSVALPSSIGNDLCLWTVVVDGKPVLLKLWDTAGQERFHSITRQILHKAQAFLLMYDITSSHSFSAVSYWASCIQDGASEDVIVLLLGNKSDDAKRQVNTKEGETLAKEHNFEFMECSAATGENVIQALESVARMLSQNADTREEATVLFKEPQKKKSSGCC